jgi:arsenate reductase (thioredoxin)
MKTKVLFICRRNSGRSQIAEAFLKQMGGEAFHVESAGFEPAAAVNPTVVAVMKEAGFDLADKKPQSVFEKFKKGSLYDYVITVCADSEGDCPVFPGIVKRLHMPFPDPAGAKGSPEEQLNQIRAIRDRIRQWLAKEMDTLKK